MSGAVYTELELALGARVAEDTTFATVQTSANAGVANIGADGWPAVLLSILSGKTIETNAIAQHIHVKKRISFSAVIGTRIPEGETGESRLSTDGIYELYDRLQGKLLGFIPEITAPNVTAVYPCYEQDFFVDRLEKGGVDLDVLYWIDLEMHNPVNA